MSMKSKYTLATYFKQKWWPIIKELLIITLSILLILTTIIFGIKILNYFYKNNITIFNSIIALIVIIIIISVIHADYQDCKKEYYQDYQERKQYYEYCKKLYQEKHHEK